MIGHISQVQVLVMVALTRLVGAGPCEDTGHDQKESRSWMLLQHMSEYLGSALAKTSIFRG